MEEPYDCHSREVYVNKEVAKGTVELPTQFFEHAGIEPGHHVVVNHGGKHLKARSKLNDLLRSTEVGMSPHLSALLDLGNGDIVCVEDKTSIGDRLFDEAEELVEVLEGGAEQVVDFAVEDIGGLVEKSVDEVLDHIVRDRDREPEKDYIEVTPDLSEIGDEVEEKGEEPTEKVKVWSPDPDGDAPIFKPEQDENEPD